jgi:hypothetical protein
LCGAWGQFGDSEERVERSLDGLRDDPLAYALLWWGMVSRMVAE